MSVTARLTELGITLPKFQAAVGTYRKCIQEGDKLYTSTHFGMDDAGKTVPGKVGLSGQPGTITPQDAKLLARNAGLRLLSTLQNQLDGDLDRIEQVIKLHAIVNGEPDFTGHGEVINGCSDVLCEVLGDEVGKGVRTCTGAGSLAAAVTCDLVVRIKN